MIVELSYQTLAALMSLQKPGKIVNVQREGKDRIRIHVEGVPEAEHPIVTGVSLNVFSITHHILLWPGAKTEVGPPTLELPPMEEPKT